MTPNAKILSAARQEFASLLRKDTKESEWQHFFAAKPFVLSLGLPLTLSSTHIVPRGRPGRSEADFIFYDATCGSPLYGVIELKRPDSRILRLPRNNIVSLSRDAQTAVAQSKAYANDLDKELGYHPSRMLAVGNSAHCFIIMGLSEEIGRALINETLQWQFSQLLHGGFRIIPYDELFEQFSRQIPPAIYFLTPIARNPPPSIVWEDGFPVVDYSGLPANALEHPVIHLKGVARISGIGAVHLVNHGACPYCGLIHRDNSESGRVGTPAGAFQKFFYTQENGYLVRLLYCSSTPTNQKMMYKERYDAEQVSHWFTELQTGVCRRCGRSRISFRDASFDDLHDNKRWECDNCGFYEERHSWRPLSWGA